ncbi:hypothetical protein OQI_14720 [Streptomyces pharetrae CZA14]|uniref:Uncharacterized protein n=1 Tax=Streptomyces pharetrae CZA14 TaxID=1144883 RepID=A0ABX3YIF1_9ACTN|nr:hypothetical protein OQI_14720 [Streptomyces pharetrae CZA14]
MTRREAAQRLFTDRPLMTTRVSRDSGRTWEPERAVLASDDLAPLMTSAWPPCKCARCAESGKRSGR